MIVLIVFIVVLETGQFHVVLAFYVSKTKFACRLNLAAKKNKIKTRKEELVYPNIIIIMFDDHPVRKQALLKYKNIEFTE